jgi:hypothetical protein
MMERRPVIIVLRPLRLLHSGTSSSVRLNPIMDREQVAAAVATSSPHQGSRDRSRSKRQRHARRVDEDALATHTVAGDASKARRKPASQRDARI